jgi:hypothetical protein
MLADHEAIARASEEFDIDASRLPAISKIRSSVD